MKRPVQIALVLAVALTGATFAAGSKSGKSEPAPQNSRQEFGSTVFDFGHVGIDYTIYHRYPFVNRTADTVRILSVAVHCDCSSAICADSVLPPGDSTTINLRFSTKNFYGPQNKSITVTTDHPALRSVELFYLSIIGQWFEGIRPAPEAIFFLQANEPKKITIPNRNFDQIAITDVTQLDNHFNVRVVTPKARKSESLEVEITPGNGIGKGTLHSNVTLHVDCGNGDPTVLTIPIKIVRY